MSSMLEAKRATRGLRMADLVGQAAEDDEQFWNNEIWQEDGSDAESFRSEDEEVKPDEFDSDFNDSETEGEEESDDDAKIKKVARAQMVKQSKATNKYKDPTAAAPRPAAKRQLDEDGNPVQKQRKTTDSSMAYSGPIERSVRGSTKAKTQTAEEAGKIRAQLQERAMKARLDVERPGRTEFRQKDLLMEALDTEEANAKWLVAQTMQESERAQADKPAKTHSESYIRFSSRRGTYNTITFSQVEVMPPILSGHLSPPTTGPQKCVITGLPAKYRDPATMLPYATVEAFREIRRRYGDNRDDMYWSDNAGTANGHGYASGGGFDSRAGSRGDLTLAK